MKSFNQQVINKNNNNDINKSKTRHHIVISDKNYLILKQLGYTSESMNDVLDKILAKIPGVYQIDVTEKE